MFEKVYLPVSTLHSWDKNPRNIQQKDFARLVEHLETMEQIRPLLVMPDGTVLGGNMRLRAYQQMGTETVWVTIVDIYQRSDALWGAKVDNKEANKRWNSREDAMMEYSLLDNDRSGYYDSDLLANLMPQYSIDWGQYAVDIDTPVTLQQLIDNVAPEPDSSTADSSTDNSPQQVECPECHAHFDPSKYLIDKTT